MLNEPVIGEEFFGRSEVLSLLKKRTHALKEGYRQNIALTGQSLSGKSSILHHFLYTFTDKEILPIYVEVTDESLIYFSHKFIGSLLYNFFKLKGFDVKEDLGFLIESAKSSIPYTAKAVMDILELIKKKDYDRAYSKLFDLTGVVKEETGKSCAIILDEFHNLASLNVKNPFKGFGKKIMVQRDTMYIVTSSQVTTIKKILNEKLSLLFGNFEIIEVGGFKTEHARAFLKERFKYVRMPEEFKDFIIAFTEGSPFYMDIISQSIKEAVLAMTFKRVTHETLIKGLKKTIFNSKGCIYQYLANYIETVKKKRSSEIYLSLLLILANGSYRLIDIAKAAKKRPGDVSKYLSDLIEMNMLRKNGTFYKFVDKMLGFWLRFVYQKRSSAILSYLPDRARIFAEESSELINDFLDEQKKEIIDRAAALFNSFANETVIISDKEYKLPPFSSVEIKSPENSRPYIVSKAKNNYWVASLVTGELRDMDIIDITERVKMFDIKARRKILIALSGIEMNARLMAKEENIWIWDIETLNQLMSLYDRWKIMSYKYRGKERKTP